MSRSDAEARGKDETDPEGDGSRAGHPLPAAERAFRWITAYRRQAKFEPVVIQVSA